MATERVEVEKLSDALVEQAAAMEALKAAAGALAAAEAAYRLQLADFERAQRAAESVSLRVAGLVQRDTGAIPAPPLARVQDMVAARAEMWKKQRDDV